MQARLARLKTWDLLKRSTIVQSLDSLHQVPKEVLQGDQNGIKTNFGYHRQKNTIWKLCDHITQLHNSIY
jgi:hypothetical protein